MDYNNLANRPTIPTNTDQITEASQLYYTDERVDDRVSNLLVAGTGISLVYNDGAGTLTIDATGLAPPNTDSLAEGAVNLYYTEARANAAIDARVTSAFVNALNVDANLLGGFGPAHYLDYNNLANLPTIPSNTDQITEASQLYYTNERVDDRVNDLLVAGTGVTLTYDDGAGTLTIDATGVGVSDTDALPEGAVNLYYTDARANAAIDARVDAAYINAFNIDANLLGGNTPAFFLDYNNLSNRPTIPTTTDQIAEASQLYYTDERVDDRVASLLVGGPGVTLTYNDGPGTLTIDVASLSSTDGLAEGVTNLYFTEARANAAIDARVNSAFVNALTVDANTLGGNTPAFYLDYNNLANRPAIPSNTDELAEGLSNFYFTNERVDDRVNDLLVAGAGITLTYADGPGTLTIDATGVGISDTDALPEGVTNLYYTDARANAAIDARVDAAYINAFNIDANQLGGFSPAYYLDYNNLANLPTIPSNTDQITEASQLYFTNERVDDRVNNLLVAGTGVTLTYNDAAGSLTIDVATSGITDTDDVPEGSTNLYYTGTRVNNAIDIRVNSSFINALNVDANLLGGFAPAYYLDYTNLANQPTIPSTTDQISEASNLYYTDERVDDRVAALLQAGDNITLTYNDGPGTLTIDADQNRATVADAPPVGAQEGDFWVDSETGELYVFYDDSDSSQWVGINAQSSANNATVSPFVDTGTYVYYGGPRNVGIGTAVPAQALDVVGNIQASGDVIAYSDLRLKNSVVTMEDGLDIVKQLRGVRFTRKRASKRQVGLIAQEVQEVLPEAVYQDNETGFLGVSYGNIVGVLIEAIKSQQEQIDELHRRIANKK